MKRMNQSEAHLDTDQLRGFLAVAQAGNLTRAAEKLGISQPALSRSMQRLEATIGCSLFERGSRAMTLTDAGERFREKAGLVVHTLDQAVSELTDQPDRGLVRVAAIPTIAPYFLPGFLTRFAEAYPRAQVVVQEETTEVLIEWVRQGEVDLALAALPISSEHLSVTPVIEEDLHLVVPNGHRLAELESICLADLKSEPVVLLSEAHCLAGAVERFCKNQDIHPVVVERVHQITMVLELVALSHGVSFIPEMARRADESTRRIYKSLTDHAPRRQIVELSNPHRFRSQIVDAFRRMLGEYAMEWSQE